MRSVLAISAFAIIIAVVSLTHAAYGLTGTNVTLSSSQNPSAYDQSVTFTATILPTNGTIPDGETVTFFDGNTTVGTGTTAGGVATFATSSLLSGSHAITATYSGDANFTTSTSAVLSQTVNQSATTVYLSSSANPSAPGQQVTFTASVYPSSGTIPDNETVTFFDGNTTIGNGITVSGGAIVTISSLSLGDHSITAVYLGDGNFMPSTSTALIQSIAQTTTTTYISSSANPSASGQSVTFTATVYPLTGAIPDGETVTFFDGNTTIGTGTTAGGTATFTTSALSLGQHSITAAYPGDASNMVSTSTAITQTVVQISTTTVATSYNPSVYGQSVTFTATVMPPNATGTTQFTIDGTSVGTSTISGGTSSYTTYFLSVGSHSVVATYSGDTNYAASTSTTLSQTVNKNPNQITGSATSCSGLASCKYAISGGSASASAGVGGYVGQSPLLFSRGSVSFLLPGETNATYATGVYNGQAILSGYTSTAGTLYTVTGQFSAIDSNTGKIVLGTTQDVVGIKGHSGRGGGIYFTLVSGSITLVPTNIDGTSTTLTCSPSTVQSGSRSTCTVTAKDNANATNIPTGTVTFSTSNTGIGSFNPSSCTLASGSCAVSFVTNQEYGAGTTSIYATYSGDSTHNASSASTLLYTTAPPGGDTGGD